MNRNKINEKLRERIVDLADLWDGKESSHYGMILREVLEGLSIHDVPDFYGKENMEKMLRDIYHE